MAARTFFTRLNEGRSSWLDEGALLKACEEFFSYNGYDKVEYQKTFEGAHSQFVSPITATITDGDQLQMLATYFKPKLEKHDISLLGSVESALFDVVDNYDSARLVLVTDSLSYFPVVQNAELNVAIENLMDEGLYILFVNGRSGHALFDDFKRLGAPIPVAD